MTRKGAIKELISKVEGRKDTAHDHAAVFPSETAYGKCTWHDSHRASTQGSLDAAKALHEAVLPGWGWSYYSDDGHCIIGPKKEPDGTDIYEESHHDDPARAWLLAILRALHSMEKE